MPQNNKWVEIAAGLKNPNMRKALGLVLAGEDDKLGNSSQSVKDLHRWTKIGLLVDQDQRWILNEELLNDTLAAASATNTQHTGILRFFSGDRLNALPARPADRHEVMVHIRDRVLAAQESLREDQLNERLAVIHEDVALIRRYMVDHNLVQRDADGTAYRMPVT
ncbi:MAG TPA: hypothetical protein DCY59_02750 [Micrococcaceae bacterium]|nr:hypothetical protein [Micrococcaceae bacterium]